MEPLLNTNKVQERLHRKLLHYIRKANRDFNLIEPNDRVLVGLSGGKDSHTLTALLHELSRTTKLFTMQAYTLDQGQPGFNDVHLRAYLEAHQIPHVIEFRNTYKIVTEKIPEGKTYCSLCSRLRRGNIYRFAKENGFNKIALGHHREDLITTLLMSILYAGQVRSMPPKLLSDDKQNVVIRPLVYCQERDIAQYATLRAFPIIPCNLCGSQENLARKKVRALIDNLTKDNPKVPSNMLHALSTVCPSQLMDKNLWDFKNLIISDASTTPPEDSPMPIQPLSLTEMLRQGALHDA